MKVTIKVFTDLSITELYAILQLRSEVFVVEQDCVYQDIDGKDQQAIHVCGFKAGKLVAYTRVFKPGDYFKETAIGRVVVQQSERKYGYGKIIMEHSLDYINDHFPDQGTTLSAQTYLLAFYEGLGFRAIGAGYLEDGIPHIKMTKSNK